MVFNVIYHALKCLGLVDSETGYSRIHDVSPTTRRDSPVLPDLQGNVLQYDNDDYDAEDGDSKEEVRL